MKMKGVCRVRNKIEEIRIAKQMTNDDVAAKSGLNKVTVIKAKKQNLETTRMALSTFIAIANAMDVTIFELLDSESDISKQAERMIKVRTKTFNREKISALKKIAKSMGAEIEIKNESEIS